jgi:acyl-CoA synthetase (AMP-forming)/AMP-acid ligase II
MPGSDFDNVPQRFQIPATENRRFFALRSGMERVTYAGLDARTVVVCDRLTAAGIAKGALAGIPLGCSLATITSFLAVLKAGGAIVPLAPSGRLDQQRTRFAQEVEAASRARHQYIGKWVYRKMGAVA